MAEENTNNNIVETQPVQQDPIVTPDDVLPVSEEQNILGPSTAENQMATQQAINEQAEQDLLNQQASDLSQNKLDLARQSLLAESRTGIPAAEPTPKEILEKVRQQDLDREVLLDNQKFDQEQQAAQLQARKQQRIIDLTDAKKYGIQLDPDPELDSLIEQDAQAEQIIQETENEEVKNIENRLNEAVTPTEIEIETAAAPIRQQKAQQDAEQQDQAQRQQDELGIAEEYKKQSLALDKRLENIKNTKIEASGPFGADKSAGQKILAALAIALGGIGQGLLGTKSNAAMDLIQKEIDRSIENQKEKRQMLIEEIEGQREEYYKQMQAYLAEKSFNLKNDQTRANIAKLNAEMEAKKQEAQQKKESALQAKAVQEYFAKTGEIPAQFLTEDMRKAAKDIRSEYNKETKELKTSDSVSAYRKLREISKDNTGAADLAIVYNFMKSQDPGSVVREGEFRTAAQARSWLDRSEEGGIPIPTIVKQAVLKAQTGRILTDSQRRQFLNTAKQSVIGLLKQQKDVNDRHIDLAKQSGVPTNLLGLRKYDINEIKKDSGLTSKEKNEANIQALTNRGLSRKKAIDALKQSGKYFK